MNYPGTRWHKCDLHVHTPASQCFTDRDTVTPEQWVQACIDKGLTCVAVTDHNTGEWIDKIKEASEGLGLTVFPGLELTCSEAKVHLLVIFDTNATTQIVEDFVIKCGINRDKFSEQDAHSILSIAEVLNEAKTAGAIVIPAHVDEFNGLKNAANATLDTLFSSELVDAVQVVHRDFALTDEDYQALDKNDVLQSQISYYGLKENGLSLNDLKKSRGCVSKAIDSGKSILTLSDNPHQQGDSKHGLWGIGSRYTWLKMEQSPSLESLRQALILPDLRVKNDFDGQDPSSTPDLWIEKIVIKNTKITSDSEPLTISFSPQMTSIIGGRGSGKSSLIRFIIGVLNKQNELGSLKQLLDEFNNFFKEADRRNGVLNDLTEIELYINRLGEKYKVLYKHDSPVKNSLLKLIGDEFVEIDERISDLFDVEIFSQKQIFEIANKPNALRVLLDDNSPDVGETETELELLRQDYYSTKADIRRYQAELSKKSELKVKQEDLANRLKALSKSGLGELSKKQKDYQEDQQNIINFQTEVSEKESSVKELIGNFDEISEIDLPIDVERSKDLNSILNEKKKELLALMQHLEEIPEKLSELKNDTDDAISKINWSVEYAKLKQEFSDAVEGLQDQGIDPEKSKELLEDIEKTEEKLKKLDKVESRLTKAKEKAEALRTKYFDTRAKLSKTRQEYIDGLLNESDGSVRVKVKTYQDRYNLESNLRRILSATNSFEGDFELIGTNLPRDSRQQTILRYMDGLIDDFRTMTQDSYEGDLSGYFVNKVKQIDDESWDKLELLLPEDEIVVEYKAGGDQYIPIASGSAGQKTAAILTLILSYRTNPLILDQPEDDLDNSLIYELIVEQLKKSKEHRQIIVVTHNANIPVNGDSELVIVMDSTTSDVQIDESGSIEDEVIKAKICTIMEGGTKAFEMRAKRYNIQ